MALTGSETHRPDACAAKIKGARHAVPLSFFGVALPPQLCYKRRTGRANRLPLYENIAPASSPAAGTAEAGGSTSLFLGHDGSPRFPGEDRKPLTGQRGRLVYIAS